MRVAAREHPMGPSEERLSAKTLPYKVLMLSEPVVPMDQVVSKHDVT